MTQFLAQPGLAPTSPSANSINGLSAVVAQFQTVPQQAGQPVVGGYVVFVQLDGATYRLLGYTDQQQVASYSNVFRQAIGSFQRLTDVRALSVKPTRVRLVQLTSPMTLAQFNTRYPSTIPIEQLAVINGLDSATTTMPAGTWVKRVAE